MSNKVGCGPHTPGVPLSRCLQGVHCQRGVLGCHRSEDSQPQGSLAEVGHVSQLCPWLLSQSTCSSHSLGGQSVREVVSPQ